MADGQQCAICLDPLPAHLIATVQPCRHKCFDFDCLSRWLERRASCPLCKFLPGRSLRLSLICYSGNGRVLSVDCPSTSSEHREHVTPPTTATPDHGSVRSYIHGRKRSRYTASQRWQRIPSISSEEALERRKDVYTNKLYSFHVGANRLSRFQNFTPAQVARDEELSARARKWVRRELQVFDNRHSLSTQGDRSPCGIRNSEFLLEYIMAILRTIDIKGCNGQAEELLQDFLGRENARLFLHELRAWLRSPYNELYQWDRHVQYPKKSSRRI